MVLGMSLSTYTLIHVIHQPGGNWFRVHRHVRPAEQQTPGRLDRNFSHHHRLTSVTGFFFPFEGFKPSYVLAGLSLILLAIAIWARYSRRLEGGARRTYIVTAALALYFNCFVGVIQAFAKVPALACPGPDTEGTALPGRATGCSRDLHLAHDSRSQTFSPGVAHASPNGGCRALTLDEASTEPKLISTADTPHLRRLQSFKEELVCPPSPSKTGPRFTTKTGEPASPSSSAMAGR